MSYRDFEERRKRLLHMASKKMLISLEQSANKLNCHKRTVQRILDGLRDDGYDIRYDPDISRFIFYNLEALSPGQLAYFKE